MTTAQVVDLIREERALDLTLVGSFAGGEVGAVDVRGADGARYVLKWWPGEEGLEAARRSAALVEHLRARGYPAPWYPLVDVVGGVTVMLQEHVGGAVSDEVSEAVVEQLLAFNELQAGAGENDDQGWQEYIRSSLTEGCDGCCRNESLRGYDGRTASLLNDTGKIGRGHDARAFPTGDAVHIDFHHRNVLVRDGRVSAVIDWEGCRTGDRFFDLVTLAFGLSVATVREHARELVWTSLCAGTERSIRRSYVAHMALRQVDWSIRHRTPEDIDHWLAVADDLLTRP